MEAARVEQVGRRPGCGGGPRQFLVVQERRPRTGVVDRAAGVDRVDRIECPVAWVAAPPGSVVRGGRAFHHGRVIHPPRPCTSGGLFHHQVCGVHGRGRRPRRGELRPPGARRRCAAGRDVPVHAEADAEGRGSGGPHPHRDRVDPAFHELVVDDVGDALPGPGRDDLPARLPGPADGGFPGEGRLPAGEQAAVAAVRPMLRCGRESEPPVGDEHPGRCGGRGDEPEPQLRPARTTR